MPSLSVEFHPDAIEESRGAWQWYAERSATAAKAFVAELDRAIEELAETPERWPQYLHATRRFLLHRFPFSVVYRRTGTTLQVIAVAHARRKPGYWKQR